MEFSVLGFFWFLQIGMGLTQRPVLGEGGEKDCWSFSGFVSFRLIRD